MDRGGFRKSRPAAEMLPEIVEEYRKGRGPQKRPKKVQTTLRLSPEVLEFFKMQGPGWQKKMDKALKEMETCTQQGCLRTLIVKQ